MKFYNTENGVLTLVPQCRLPHNLRHVVCSFKYPYGEDIKCIVTCRVTSGEVSNAIHYFQLDKYKEIVTDCNLENHGFKKIGVSRWKKMNYKEDNDENIR